MSAYPLDYPRVHDAFVRRSTLVSPTRSTHRRAARVAGYLAGNTAVNSDVGDDRAAVTAAITAVLRWIGYPRTLDAPSVTDSGNRQSDS